MELKWRKVESTIMPKELDHTSSPTTVYMRKNITLVERDGQIFYEYDEAKLSNFDYQTYNDEKAAADTAYLAMMLDIDLDEDEEEVSEDE